MKKSMMLSPDEATDSHLTVMETGRSSGSQTLERRGNSNGGANARFVAGDKFFNYQQFGALRDGGEVRLFSKSYLGIVVSTLTSAWVYAFLRYCVRTSLMNYLSLNRKETTAVMECLLSLPTSFSFFAGLLSDVIPIGGYRRKSYMVIGSVFSFVMCGGLAVLAFSVDLDTKTENERGDLLVYYMVLIMGATFGTLILKIATDARVIELSQREPLTTRGALVINYLLVRTVFETMASWATKSLLQYDAKKRNFAMQINPLFVFCFLAFISILPVPFIMRNCCEHSVKQLEANIMSNMIAAGVTNVQPKTKIMDRIRSFTRMCQQRAVWQLVLFLSILLATTRFYFGAANSTFKKLANLNPDVSLRSDAIKYFVVIGTMVMWKLSWSNSSWRRCVALSILALVSFEATRALLLLYIPEARNQTVYDGFYIVMGVTDAIITVFSFIPAIEIAELGSEGATIGLLQSFRSILAIAMRTLSEQAFKNVAAVKLVQESTPHISTLCGLLMATYGVHALAFLSVFLLPRQKLDAQQLRVYGGYSKMACGLLIMIFLVMFTFAMTVNIMAIMDMATGTTTST
ncbi:TPA: hypothetical protein N0F65_000764 [Lagenidium giganteum]|uniref:Transmembrane protein n=1 Tax=Lagenidium giganteum TaxID=4803 RepID=A0AAV2ZG80_9STRA|nr:TPA: hypothetical protein N0F65_000764 [Lagenidium giganteum]